MLTCDICGQQFVLEDDIKTHLLLSHVENDMSCPFCSLSGVSYDELSFHISAAHTEKQDHISGGRSMGGGVDGGQSVSTPISSPTATRDNDHSKQARGFSRSKDHERAVTTGPRSQTIGGAVSPRTSSSTPLSQGTRTVPPGNPAVSCGSFESPVMTSAEATSSTRSANDTSRPAKTRCVEDFMQTTAIPKCLSSPLKEKLFPCPMCTLVCSDAFILQDHVELHLLREGTVEDGKSFVCPMCPVVCGDSTSLQEHVELHLDSDICAVSPGSDVSLARLLQDKEDEKEKRRKEQEAQWEVEEFKKLQRQFGVDSSGGYRRQMERTMERDVSQGLMGPADFHNKKAELMESLASGVDDGRTRTPGVLGALYEYYQRDARDCVHVWLSAETDHFCSSEGDKGWGCGYRNFQMLLSSLHRMEPYKTRISGSVPSIPQVQVLIEGAWREGLDPQGAIQFNQQLQGTRAWIGATEIYALCTSLSVRARILDFHKPTGPGDTHPCLFDWLKKYFSEAAANGARLSPRVVQTKQPPVYLQHQGHSRSIVGVEQKKNGSLCLLLLDPSCSPGEMRKLLSQDGATVSTAVRRMRKFPGSLKHRQYQLVATEGMLSPKEKQTCILNSRTLRAERIP
ncbi:hypothetical protein DPEC_G00146070 [Dallia pectoralis]|uniref:Uncharacterized protein n=1 Tax=Dallia pectoralis TaxID=75939 RepID=A0ACC2GP98_DALPE|nr:hypothetical protein DPEC_G00146070 [Dallia pectoralis]